MLRNGACPLPPSVPTLRNRSTANTRRHPRLHHRPLTPIAPLRPHTPISSPDQPRASLPPNSLLLGHEGEGVREKAGCTRDQAADVHSVPRGQRRAAHQRRADIIYIYDRRVGPVLGPVAPLRNGAWGSAAAGETLRNGACPPGPSFLNARS